jgi:hypothetical protein
MTFRTTNRMIDAVARIPDTRRESLAGFRGMRRHLQTGGMTLAEAEDWARLAVGNFRTAITRGDTVENAKAYNFSQDTAFQLLAMWRGLAPKPRGGNLKTAEAA